jgi:cbb3-type cytochrome oxidase cytochrome c subunit
VAAGIGLAAWAGTVISVTESAVLCHSQTVLPLRTTSVSLSYDGTASR